MLLEKIEFEVVTLDWKKENYQKAPAETGIYQIYGTSPLYGVDTLLYIGRAKNLQIRLAQHFGGLNKTIGRQPNKSCRFAVVSEDLYEAVEQTLIVMYKPGFNTGNINAISKKSTSRPIYIQNHGERGMLNYENTNYYFLEHNNTEMNEIIMVDNVEDLDNDENLTD